MGHTAKAEYILTVYYHLTSLVISVWIFQVALFAVVNGETFLGATEHPCGSFP